MLFSSPLWATNFFVNQEGSGDDSGDSLANAMPVADYNSGDLDASTDPGDTIYFCGTITTAIVVTEGGSAVSVLTLNGACSDEEGTDVTLSGMANGLTVNVSYIDIRNFNIENTTDRGITVNPSGASIQNIYVYDTTVDNAGGTYGIHFGSPGGQEDYSVTNVGLYDSTVRNCNDTGVGFASYGEINTFEVKRNTIHDNNDDDAGFFQNLTCSSRREEFEDANWTNTSGTIYKRSGGSEPSYTPRRVLQNETSFRELTENDGNYASLSDGEWDFYDGNLYINIGGDPSGIEIFSVLGYTHNGTFSENLVYNGSYDANIYVDNGVEDTVVENNKVYNCAQISGNGGYGIAVRAGVNITIRNNLIFDNDLHGILIYDQSSATKIYNNVIDGSSTDNIRLAGQGAPTVDIRNNIICYAGAYGIKDPYETYVETLSHNCYYGNTTADLLKVTSSGNDVTSDPSFKNRAGDDYSLSFGSPCIDAGVDLGSSYDDCLDISSAWPSGVVTKSQYLYRKWEMGAFCLPMMQGPGTGLVQ